MEFLSFIALILLSLIGYTGGAAGKAGRASELKPGILDLILVIFLWTAALVSRTAFHLNRWLAVLIWLGFGALLGIFAVWPRRLPGIPTEETAALPEKSQKRLWLEWKSFSGRMGGFQSRILLSFFYFLVVLPFALAVRMFSDPLDLKRKGRGSLWLARKESTSGLEESKRQF